MTKNKLYLVYLGGKAKGSNIENHDLRWVVGETIESTFNELRRQWYGQSKGLHIDSYIAINYIDGFQVNLLNANEGKEIGKSIVQEKLWFINLGGYDRSVMNELHEFSLVVAYSAKIAKSKAKSNLLRDAISKHVDNLSHINGCVGIDECLQIERIGEWKIELVKDPQCRSQSMRPDWFGYRRID